MRPLGLYLHIPFCKAKCIYCDFYSLPHSEEKMDAYTAALVRHLEEVAPRAAGMQVDTVYFGGGTPSYLGVSRLTRLLQTVLRRYDVARGAEITLEANPDSAGDWRELRKLRRAGFNRLSLGVQSTDDALLRRIGRVHTYEQVQQAVTAARKAKIENLSLDLIYGLPDQTMEDWQRTLADAVALGPEHLSCYGLKVEEGTPLWQQRQQLTLTDDDAQADMYSYAAEMLERYGYKQYEISNFAAPGYESKHNLKYWNMDDYMSFGPGAHSCIGNVRYSFVKDLKQYIYGVHKKISIVDEYEQIDPLERAVEYVMLGMRTSRGISEHDYRLRCQCDWKPILKVLQAFKEKRWVELTEDRWHFTVPGFLISNTLIGIMLETQASGRIDSTPWMQDADRAAYKISLPKGEEELFAELYEQKMNQ